MADPFLELRGIGKLYPGVVALDDVSLAVEPGEVIGLVGENGAGKSTLMKVLGGVVKPTTGRIRIDGVEREAISVSDAISAGIAFVPESRRSMLFHQEPVYKNATISILDRISRLWLRPARERAIAREQVKRLDIRPPKVDALLGNLSGGNQQKVALAKWLAYAPKVLILSEPTRGMDVGAKNDVIHIIRDLRARGLAVIVLSTEPETVLSLADRVIVLKRGAVVREFSNEQISKDRLLEAA